MLDKKGSVEEAFPGLKGTYFIETDEIFDDDHHMPRCFHEQWVGEITEFAQDLGGDEVPYPDIGLEDIAAEKVKKRLAYDRKCQDIGLQKVLPFLDRHKGEFFYRVDVYDWSDEYQVLKMALKDVDYLETGQHG